MNGNELDGKRGVRRVNETSNPAIHQHQDHDNLCLTTKAGCPHYSYINLILHSPLTCEQHPEILEFLLSSNLKGTRHFSPVQIKGLKLEKHGPLHQHVSQERHALSSWTSFHTILLDFCEGGGYSVSPDSICDETQRHGMVCILHRRFKERIAEQSWRIRVSRSRLNKHPTLYYIFIQIQIFHRNFSTYEEKDKLCFVYSLWHKASSSASANMTL